MQINVEKSNLALLINKNHWSYIILEFTDPLLFRGFTIGLIILHILLFIIIILLLLLLALLY